MYFNFGLTNRKTRKIEFFYGWQVSPQGKYSVHQNDGRVATDECHSKGTECHKGSDVYKLIVEASKKAIAKNPDLFLQEFPVFEGRVYPIDYMSTEAVNISNEIITNYQESTLADLFIEYNANNTDDLVENMRNGFLDDGEGFTIIFLANGNVLYG